MTCREAQHNFSSYLDDALSPAARSACDAHLEVCPFCRARLIEMRQLTRALTNLKRPAAPPDLANSIQSALVIEQAARRVIRPRPVPVRFVDWLTPRLMPYTVGAVASLILFFSVLTALRPSVAILAEVGRAARQAANSPSNRTRVEADDDFTDINIPVSAEDYATSRLPFTIESPSLNPRGALATIHWDTLGGRTGDDDMVVVADVDHNGEATLAEVVQPPRNAAMLREFEAALERNPAFVPAALDHRPELVRVVFVMQTIDVRERSY